MTAHGTPSAERWNEYARWNRRDERMAMLWVQDLVAWLKATGLAHRQAAFFDFGCGYFDVGMALANDVRRVDGFDISPETCDLAAARPKGDLEATVYRSLAAAPRGTYDVVLANSVFQYLPDAVTVQATLTQLRWLLKPRATAMSPAPCLVISDILPRSYSAPLDAWRSLQVATLHGVLPAMVRHLWKAATRSDGLTLLQINLDEMTALAAAAGLSCRPLTPNLTPSRQRYTVQLEPL